MTGNVGLTISTINNYNPVYEFRIDRNICFYILKQGKHVLFNGYNVIYTWISRYSYFLTSSSRNGQSKSRKLEKKKVTANRYKSSQMKG